MTLLPAQVPDIPESRAGIVPARIARKVAPLFGVSWDGNPYGLTWVSDYVKVSLTEIARGAPVPSRGDLSALSPGPRPATWQVVNRAVASHRPSPTARPEPLPNEIANATLNRFGPDTKAAVVLTGANALFEPVCAAIIEALTHLEQRTPIGMLPVRVRIGAWASLVLEAFRSQPALFVAAAQARAVQRAALQAWSIPTLTDRSCARVELGRSAEQAPPAGGSSPTCFDLVDATIKALALGPSSGDQLADRLQAERIQSRLVEEWLSRLVSLGTVTGEGFLWLAEDPPGHRRVEAFTPHDPTLWRFLTDIAPLVPAASDPILGTAGIGSATFVSTMPSIPLASELADLGLLTRRSIVIALTTFVRLAFNSGSPDPSGDLHTLATLDQLGAVAQQSLPPDDPATALTRCRVADMRLELVRQDSAFDDQLADAVTGLFAELASIRRLAAAGTLNASDAAELIRSGCVELMVLLRRDGADEPHWTVLPPQRFRAKLAGLWRTMLELMQIDLNTLHEQPRPIQLLVGYQLHDYVTFLGGTGSEAEAATAAFLYRDFVIPARQDYYRQTGFFQPLLYSYQNATRATTRLADMAGARGDHATAQEFAGHGRTWITAALAAPYSVEMLAASLADATDEVCRFALLAVPALLSGIQYDASPDPAGDLSQCDRLLDHAVRFADRFAKSGGRYARAGELVALIDRLASARVAVD